MHTEIPQPISFFNHPPKHYILFFCMRLKFPLPSEIIHLFCGILFLRMKVRIYKTYVLFCIFKSQY